MYLRQVQGFESFTRVWVLNLNMWITQFLCSKRFDCFQKYDGDFYTCLGFKKKKNSWIFKT